MQRLKRQIKQLEEANRGLKGLSGEREALS
jgi:hypothetical protein